MDEDKKKKVMLGIIGVSVLVVAIMTIGRMGGDKAGEIPEFEGQVEWVLCRNPDCEANYSMPMKDFYEKLNELRPPGSPVVPAFVCEKCNEESVFRAVKCEKCELIFEPGSIYSVHGDTDDYGDRCPKCKYSHKEIKRGITYKPRKRR